MTLNETQVKEIKRQLLEQIETSFPEDKKFSAKQQIESMNTSQLEQFLIQNKLITPEGGQKAEETQNTNCIFCSIVEGKIPSKIIAQNDLAIATLEINPISKGHTLIVPKKHIEKIEDMPPELKTFGEEVMKVIREKFSPKDIMVAPSPVMNHWVVNLIPVYKDETLESERKQITPEELEEVAKELGSGPTPEKSKEKSEEKPKDKPKEIEEKPKEEITSENTWLPIRKP